MDDIFQSSPLTIGSQSIRVLDLEPQTDGQRLVGSLRTVCLTDNPEFTALSYVWGTEVAADTQITVNGHQKSITKNCYDALITLCKEHGALTIWVDSICINQQDNVEKNDQILLMEDIYSWAQTVYIWFGESTPQSDAAMDCLSLVPNSFQCLWLTDWAASTRFSNRSKAACYALIRAGWFCFKAFLNIRHSSGHGDGELCRQFIKGYEIEDFEDLLSRDWLSRVWTFQEAILACKPVIICGNKSVTWDDFIRGVQYLFYVQQCFEKDPLDWSGMNDKIYHEDIELIPTPWPKSQHMKLELPFQIPHSYRTWTAVFITWINLQRTTHWNGKMIRRYIKTKTSRSSGTVSGSSFGLYQYWGHLHLRLLARMVLTFVCLAGITMVVMSFRLDNTKFSWSYSAMMTVTTILSILGVLVTVLSVLGFVLTMHNSGPVATCLANPDITDGDLSRSIYRAMRERNATDPKDRAFAFYGVLSRLGVKLCKPNYAIPLGEVYENLFRDLLTYGWSINMILDGGISGFPSSPSWVPDWSSASSKNWIQEEYIYKEPKCTATPGSTPVFEFEDQRILKVYGSQHGSVIFRSDDLQHAGNLLSRRGSKSPQRAHHNNLRSLLHTLTAFKSQARLLGPNETLSNGVYEIIHARTTQRTDYKLRDSFQSWYSIMIETTSTTDDIDDQISVCDAKLAQNNLALEYHNNLCLAMANRRIFFITSAGCLGTGSQHIAEADQVTLVSGVNMPLILRERENTEHCLISPAFVYGIMGGEFWNPNEIEEIKLI